MPADHIQQPHMEAATRRARMAQRTRGRIQQRHARAALAHLSQHQLDTLPVFGHGHIAPDFEADMIRLAG